MGICGSKKDKKDSNIEEVKVDEEFNNEGNALMWSSPPYDISASTLQVNNNNKSSIEKNGKLLRESFLDHNKKDGDKSQSSQYEIIVEVNNSEYEGGSQKSVKEELILFDSIVVHEEVIDEKEIHIEESDMDPILIVGRFLELRNEEKYYAAAILCTENMEWDYKGHVINGINEIQKKWAEYDKEEEKMFIEWGF